MTPCSDTSIWNKSFPVFQRWTTTLFRLFLTAVAKNCREATREISGTPMTRKIWQIKTCLLCLAVRLWSAYLRNQRLSKTTLNVSQTIWTKLVAFWSYQLLLTSGSKLSLKSLQLSAGRSPNNSFTTFQEPIKKAAAKKASLKQNKRSWVTVRR